MKEIKNRIDLCFNLMDVYEEKIKDLILRNGIKEEDANNIIKNFRFKNEIIFSLNKEYKKGSLLKDFCQDNNLSLDIPNMLNFHHSLYKHQENAIKSILEDKCTIVSTGTGSGKTESFLIPILDYCIKNKYKKGVKALIIYPMNALASDQLRRIEKATSNSGITYAIFNGETPNRNDIKDIDDDNSIICREDIVENKPDILITNYVMLERILTNEKYSHIFESLDKVFKYIVLDEIHTYNGNKALHIKFLLDRLRYYVNTKVVQIGSSATLSRNKDGVKTDGYISGEIDEFITNMFSLTTKEEYKYIEPIYEEIENDNNIKDEDYNKFKNDIKTKIIKNYLYDGCKSFSEILKKLSDNNINTSEESLKSYFYNILSLNEKYNNNPILDFRIHLFLLDIGKVLRRCVNCGKHYTLNIYKCNDCGNIILPVYKKEPNLLVGKLKDGEISDFFPSDNTKNQNLVLINFSSNEYNQFKHKLNFDLYESKSKSIKLIIDKEGQYKVYSDLNINNSDIDDILIKFNDSSKEIFLYELLKHNFNILSEKERKILAFIDNREKCGRYSTVLGDDLLSQFYFELLKFCNSNEGLSINELKNEVLKVVNEYLNNNIVNENIKEIIINDFNIWFRRALVNKRFREDFKDMNLELRLSDNFNDVDRFITNVALDEGVFFQSKLETPGKVIRISRSSFEYPKGIGFKTSKDSNVISLSEYGIKYSEFIKEYGQDKLKNSVEKLVSYNILNEKTQNNSCNKEDYFQTSTFYLNKDNTFIKTEPSKYNTLREIFEEHFLLTGAHSSEVAKDLKKVYEDSFQNADINLLIATPTLEMGIDIGNLSFVYMLGVPQMPSSYAQRAGRAGRRGDRFAGIITICSEKSNHDWYYFYNPKEMIEGLITPPRFDVDNKKVLNKHINTIVYSRLNDRKFTYISDKENISDKEKEDIKKECETIFNKNIDIDYNIEFLGEKVKSINGFSKESLYNSAIYPEYCFSRHNVALIEEVKDKNNCIKKVELGVREPELAYKQIIPKTSMFIGEKHYSIELFKDYSTFTSMNNKEVISSWKYKCKDNERNIKKDKDINGENSYVLIDLNKHHNIVKEKGPIKVYNNNNMKIEFISEVKRDGEDLAVGYQLIRDTIIFEFHKSVISKEQYTSLMSLLDKTIKYELGLDEGEISLIVDDEIIVNENLQDKDDKNKAYVLIYDKTGNENINMSDIVEKVFPSIDIGTEETLLSKAYTRVSNCECEKQSGCYLCIKSFNTQRYAHSLNKNSAKNFVGYLIGKERLRPHISITEEILRYELEINVRQKGNEIKLTSNNKEKILNNIGNQNETIINGILQELIDIYENNDIETIIITSNLDYLVNGINQTGNLKVSDDSLNLFMFYKQAFKSIIAEKMRVK